MVGGITPLVIAIMQAKASMAAVPPNKCPVIDFVEEIFIL
jgi:hypothetical protein